jgi:hypothetical protein
VTILERSQATTELLRFAHADKQSTDQILIGAARLLHIRLLVSDLEEPVFRVAQRLPTSAVMRDSLAMFAEHVLIFVVAGVMRRGRK